MTWTENGPFGSYPSRPHPLRWAFMERLEEELTRSPRVCEILPDGHAALTPAQLSYLVDMANRVGFYVLEPVPNRGDRTYRVRIAVSMSDPFFTARLDKQPA